MPEEDCAFEIPTWISQGRLLGNGWAVAGNFEVDFTPEGAGSVRKVLFRHWMDSDYYWGVWEERAWKLCETFPDDVVLQVLSPLEENVRTQAIELVRRKRSPVPWGVAIRMGLLLLQEAWTDAKADLYRDGSRKKRARNGTPPRDRAPRDSAPREPQKTNPKQSTKDADGVRVCPLFNSRKGCRKGAGCTDRHACDVMLASTRKACGNTSHKRSGHNAQSHGNPLNHNGSR